MNWRIQLEQWAGSLSAMAKCTRIVVQDAATAALTLARIAASVPGRLLIVTADSAAAERLASLVHTYLQMLDHSREIIAVPEVATTRGRQWLPENEAARCAALEAALSTRPALFFASVTALTSPALAPEAFSRHMFSLRVGDTDISPEGLARRLVELDYDNEFEVHAPGEFARRGGIFDLYSPLCDAPVRIEFFGDTIESMRYFLPETQRSFRETQSVRIVPRGTVVTEPEAADTTTVARYFLPGAHLAVVAPDDIEEHVTRFGDSEAAAQWRMALAEVESAFLLINEVVDSPVPIREADNESTVASECFSLGFDFTPLLPELGESAAVWQWQQLREHMLRWHSQRYHVVACCGGEGERQRFQQMLAADPKTAPLEIALELYQLDTGVFIPTAGLVLLSQRELFGRQPDVRRRRHSRYHYDLAAREGVDLEEGSHAVHASHGICLYRGIRCIEVSMELQEVMELEFDDEARLYVPLDQAHLVSRYVGGNKRMPKLSRLGGSAWQTAKQSASDAAWDLAAELLRMDAVRKQAQGFAFTEAMDWEHLFAVSFPFAETADQKEAIEAVLKDMGAAQPMDRLLCGDVGYGKTEVAMRAAFRAVLNGKQVGVLVPTTVLAQQHYRTFRERMAEYPIEIEVISRFRTKAEQKAILERLALGQLDIVIGTHRLLQRDVLFHDLGLLIVDEEQRFGVRHKQRLKQLRTSIDILTMTATPIPRTLYLSVSGLRNLSTIMTAPAERLPVTTVVAQYDRELIRQAVLREVERHGQVYFLHNRVDSIHRVATDLATLIPEARFAVGHGQMSSRELERVMGRFIAGDVDVLVCTTIIESGLDIANANTIIIDRADRFGLADLYQLRGRVGRYHRQAYAYLLLPPMGVLPQNARQRLAAIRRYTHLGAGFKLALRDLEIRGAGNILGAEQSGHIAAIGFDLYSKLLREAVNQLEHAPKQAAVQQIPCAIDTLVFGVRGAPGTSAAAIPPEYVGAERTRIECYQRLTEIKSIEDIERFAEELADRFGPPPAVTNRLLHVARLRILAHAAGIHSIMVRERKVLLETGRGFVKTRDRQLPYLSATDADEQLRELEELLQAQLQ